MQLEPSRQTTSATNAVCPFTPQPPRPHDTVTPMKIGVKRPPNTQYIILSPVEGPRSASKIDQINKHQVTCQSNQSLPANRPPKPTMPTQLQTLANTVGALLKERGETISIAESSTGGLLSAALLAVPGASAYYGGGSVVYTSPARELFLGINFDNHPGMRSASEPYAALLASTSRKLLNTTWGLSETGAAGPTGNAYGDAAGHTCVAISSENVNTEATLETGDNNREANMQTFAITALELLQKALTQN